MSILKEAGAHLEDKDILYLLHDELDMDILLPVLYEIRMRQREPISEHMLLNVFECFPRLFAWMFINMEEKLREYMGKITSYAALQRLLSMSYSNMPKMDSHLRGYIVSAFDTMLAKPEGNVMLYIYNGSSYTTAATTAATTAGSTELLKKVIGNVAHSDFEPTAGGGLTSAKYMDMDAARFLEEAEKLIRTPLVLATAARMEGFGYVKESTGFSYNADKYVHIATAYIIVPADALRGTHPNLQYKYIKRLYAQRAKAAIEIWLNTKGKEWLLVYGTQMTFTTQAYTKACVKHAIESYAPAGMHNYLKEQILLPLNNKITPIRESKGYFHALRERCASSAPREFTVYHYPCKLIDSMTRKEGGE